MLVIRFAKSLMENEEGMNHIWIQIHPDDSIKYSEQTEIVIRLPDGVYRSANLNGYPEHDSRSILLNVLEHRELLVEIFTEDAVPCGERSVEIVWRYTDRRNDKQQITATVPLRLVPFEDMDSLLVDEQVVTRLKELRRPAETETATDDTEPVLRPRALDRPNRFSYLEEMYRIDYSRKEGEIWNKN